MLEVTTLCYNNAHPVLTLPKWIQMYRHGICQNQWKRLCRGWNDLVHPIATLRWSQRAGKMFAEPIFSLWIVNRHRFRTPSMLFVKFHDNQFGLRLGLWTESTTLALKQLSNTTRTETRKYMRATSTFPKRSIWFLMIFYGLNLKVRICLQN